MELNELAEAWLLAKDQERRANTSRIDIEDQMLALMRPNREEGRTTTLLDSGLKIITTHKLSYKADFPLMLETVRDWPEAMQPVKTVVDETMLKQIRAERPDLWRTLAPAITTKAAKVGFAIENEAT
tara:strand:+ start:2786 stop:3166 length:381 start_codon:yes stop_codon:yes gene_type:complete